MSLVAAAADEGPRSGPRSLDSTAWRDPRRVVGRRVAVLGDGGGGESVRDAWCCFDDDKCVYCRRRKSRRDP